MLGLCPGALRQVLALKRFLTYTAVGSLYAVRFPSPIRNKTSHISMTANVESARNFKRFAYICATGIVTAMTIHSPDTVFVNRRLMKATKTRRSYDLSKSQEGTCFPGPGRFVSLIRTNGQFSCFGGEWPHGTRPR